MITYPYIKHMYKFIISIFTEYIFLKKKKIAANSVFISSLSFPEKWYYTSRSCIKITNSLDKASGWKKKDWNQNILWTSSAI